MNPLIICTGGNRKTSKWTKQEYSFSELIEKLKVPVVTEETFNEYLSLSKDEQDDIKDVGGYIGGTLKRGSRKKENIVSRTLVALDADNIGSSERMKKLLEDLNDLGFQFFIHSTRKHTDLTPRLRIIFPLKEPIKANEYEPLARMLCNILGMEIFDPTTVEVNRFMYWPSVSKDMLEQFKSIRGDSDFLELDSNSFLDVYYNNCLDRSEWPSFPDEKEVIKRSIAVQEDPLTKDGIVGAFCKVNYPITDAMEKHLPGIYEKTDTADNRYTYLGGSTSGGVIVYDNKFVFSHHATDPISGQLCNAFDLVRIHKFGKTKKATKEMIAYASGDPEVKNLLVNEDLQDILNKIDNEPETVPTVDTSGDTKTLIEDLLKKLDRDENGQIKKTIENVRTIMRYDPRLQGYHYNSFSDQYVVEQKMPWETLKFEKRTWDDFDDSGIRWFMEKYYGITGDKKIMDATNISFRERAYHPVRDYFDTLVWDGTERLDNLLIDYFGAKDEVYSKEVIRKSLVAAVNRIYNPGIKFDEMPVLVGKQGTGKSTFLALLGKEWYTDSLTSFDNKDAMDMLKGNLIIEIGELAALSHRYADMEQIKNFLSRTFDEYRGAYAKRKKRYPRQCVFFGTTNNSTFLRDRTGNRRFWPVQLGIDEPKKSVWNDLPDEVNQIWAEAVVNYRLGESLILSEEAQKRAKAEQENRLEEDSWKPIIIDYLLKKIPKDWYSMSLNERELFLDSYDSEDENELCYRTKTCFAELGIEALKIRQNDMDTLKTRRLSSVIDSIEGLVRTGKPSRFGTAFGRNKTVDILPEFYEINRI